MTPCPRCGVEPPGGALFCPSCGTKIVVGLETGAPSVAWDTIRPAIPDDLFRSPDEPTEPSVADEVYRSEPEIAEGTSRPDYVRGDESPAAGRSASGRLQPIPYTPVSPTPHASARERVEALPDSGRPSRANLSGASGVTILLAALVLVAMIGGVMWFTGGGAPSAPASATRVSSRSAAASQTSAASTSSSPSPAGPSSPKSPMGTPADAFPPADSTLCQGSTTVAVNSTTSCEFAAKVAAAIPDGASGTFTVTANSPVTQKEYEMICVKGTYTVCTGGVNAMVFVK